VLSFADSTDGNQRDSYADRLAGFLGDLVDELTRSGTDVRYCAQVIRDGQFGDRVLGQDNSVQRVAFQRSASSAAAVFDTYASAEVVLTNRLHSFLFALSQGALAVVVTDPAIHGKIVGIIRDMGLPELLVDLNGLDSETLIGHIDRVLADGEGILDRVSAHFDEQAERLHHWVDGWLGTPVDPDRRVVTDARAA
jgi:polysaccharide pyruvyl transferase WcaK-like protein